MPKAAAAGRSEGWLYKKGQGKSTLGRRNWKRRWCQLVQHADSSWHIEYYETQAQAATKEMKGSAVVSGARVTHVENKKKKGKDAGAPYYFDIVKTQLGGAGGFGGGKRKEPKVEVFSMYAESEEEGRAWLHALQTAAAAEAGVGQSSAAGTPVQPPSGMAQEMD